MPHAWEVMREEPTLLPSSPTIPARPHRRPRDRSNAAIAEAVCRHLLHQLAADAPPPLRHYLALRGGDPDATVLRRLQTVMPEMAPRSRCRVSARTGVTDRATGAAGVILEVTSVAWRHAGAVEVIGGYYATPWHAAAFRYRVEAAGVRWAVTMTRELWRVSPVR
jgi:hypothetical protein